MIYMNNLPAILRFLLRFATFLFLINFLRPVSAAGAISVVDPTVKNQNCTAQTNNANPATNDTERIQAVIAQAHTFEFGATIYIPAGAICTYSETIVLTKMISIIGDGHAVSQLVYTGQEDAIKMAPSIGTNEGHVIRDLFIRPLVPNSGIFGIRVELSVGSSYSYFRYDNIRIGSFANRAIWLNNLAGNQDGFFNGSITRSYLENGFRGSKIGDSISFRDVTFHGKNNVELSGLPNGISARLVTIDGGQITTSNGFLRLTQMDGFRARNVWLEPPQNAATPSYDAAVYIEDTHDAIFEGLNIAVDQNPAMAHVFALVNSRDTKIINNAFANRGSATHVYGTVDTKRTRIQGNVYFNDQRGHNIVQETIVLQGN
jgi:hypothetical protein